MGSKLLTTMVIWTILSFPSVVRANAEESPNGPLQQLRINVAGVLGALDNKKEKDKTVEERRLEARSIADRAFDFSLISRRTLGAHWDKLSPQDREDFTKKFTNLLAASYMGKIETYEGGQIQYIGEKITGDTAVVKTQVAAKNPILLDYDMQKSGDAWRVYDISINGTKMVGNYHSQLDRIMRQKDGRGFGVIMKSLDEKEQKSGK